MQENIVLKKNSTVVSRIIDNETILVPIFKTSKEMNCIYTLNPVASFVWDLIDGRKTVRQIKEAVLKKFDTTQNEATQELSKLFKDLSEIKALI